MTEADLRALQAFKKGEVRPSLVRNWLGFGCLGPRICYHTGVMAVYEHIFYRTVCTSRLTSYNSCSYCTSIPNAAMFTIKVPLLALFFPRQFSRSTLDSIASNVCAEQA